MRVEKRDGTFEDLNIDKIHKVCSWACEGITNVSVSEIEIKSHIQFYDKIKTATIQETLIKSASDLITEETPNYQYVAGRLVNYHLRKQVYNNFEPIDLHTHVTNGVKLGLYTSELFDWFSKEDFEELDNMIDHKRDFNITFAGMEQFRGKYLVRNRVSNEIIETPQMAFILIAATIFGREENRMKWIKEYYDAISTFDISLPTPIMAGLRTPQKQFSSCVLIECDDSLDSINATTSAIVKYVSQKAGIGIGVGSIRAIGSPIRNGDTSHTGIVPFIKLFQAAVASCSQGSVRKGSATLYIPFWHYEIEEVMVLKNNKGTENNRARQLDYGIQFNKVMYERLLEGGNISLFSPKDIPELYEAFFLDTDKFRILYEKAEADKSIRRKTVSALQLFSSYMQERKETGRIYLMNVDHMNDHGAFIKERATIRMSNLCCEIALPTVPLDDVNDAEGEIALCTLSAINIAKIKETGDFERPCTLAVRALDCLLSYQQFPVPAAFNSTNKYRPIGVGLVNLAYWMAKNDVNYSEPNLEMMDEYFEAWSYHLIKASMELAKEKGACPGNEDTKYSQGILPIDTYKDSVDELVKPKYRQDWKQLRKDLKAHGIRNATLMAIMPSESSSLISNSTNGIEPPRALISVKKSKDGVLRQVVPEYRRLKNKYELLWDQKSPEGYLKICAILQKYVDQAISVNTSYNPKFYENEMIPMSVLLSDLVSFYRYGGKNLYYFNTNSMTSDVEEKVELEVPINEEEDCESCKL